MSDTIEVPTPPVPAWAKLICPFRSTNHMMVQGGGQLPPQLAGIGGLAPGAAMGMKIQIIPAEIPCLGPQCAIFYSCKPGVIEVAEGAGDVGGSE